MLTRADTIQLPDLGKLGNTPWRNVSLEDGAAPGKATLSCIGAAAQGYQSKTLDGDEQVEQALVQSELRADTLGYAPHVLSGNKKFSLLKRNLKCDVDTLKLSQ